MMSRFAYCALMLAALISPAQAESPLAKEIFGHIAAPNRAASEAVGFYSRGCLSGGETLPETGPSWQAMRLSRNRNHGHPNLVSFIKGLSTVAQQQGWAGLYVGDMSQPRGGPMLTGHASHQVGLDADIWMLPPARLNLSRQEREALSSISVVSKDLSKVNELWTRGHHNVIKAAAMDPRVQRIFVTPAVKIRMCQSEREQGDWLAKIRPWWGHNYHFHIRLKCPPDSPNCKPQDDVPNGTGCAYARDFLVDMLKPKDPNAPPPKPKPPKTFDWMPAQCQTIAFD
ncbi:MAG: penicillin-insensitive murein endopeptidase [Gammaproteobacteria bacterium]|nr:penicillin-insensitive murein endopeptidase [Gammaproteobacteria bacterium]